MRSEEEPRSLLQPANTDWMPTKIPESASHPRQDEPVTGPNGMMLEHPLPTPVEVERPRPSRARRHREEWHQLQWHDQNVFARIADHWQSQRWSPPWECSWVAEARAVSLRHHLAGSVPSSGTRWLLSSMHAQSPKTAAPRLAPISTEAEFHAAQFSCSEAPKAHQEASPATAPVEVECFLSKWRNTPWPLEGSAPTNDLQQLTSPS